MPAHSPRNAYQGNQSRHSLKDSTGHRCGLVLCVPRANPSPSLGLSFPTCPVGGGTGPHLAQEQSLSISGAGAGLATSPSSSAALLTALSLKAAVPGPSSMPATALPACMFSPHCPWAVPGAAAQCALCRDLRQDWPTCPAHWGQAVMHLALGWLANVWGHLPTGFPGQGMGSAAGAPACDPQASHLPGEGREPISQWG